MGLRQPEAVTGNGRVIQISREYFRWKSTEAVLRVRLGDRIKIFCPDPRLDHRASHLKVFQVADTPWRGTENI